MNKKIAIAACLLFVWLFQFNALAYENYFNDPSDINGFSPRDWWWRQDPDQWYWHSYDGGTYWFNACQNTYPPSCCADMVNILTSEMDKQWENYTVEARMKVIDIGIVDSEGRTGYNMGLAFRVEEYIPDRDCEELSGHGYLFHLIHKDNKRWASLDRCDGTDLRCWEDPMRLVRIPFSYALDTYYTLKVVLDGPNIKCYVNGGLVIEYWDGTWPTGTVGFTSFGSKICIDYLTVDVIGNLYMVTGPGPGSNNPPLVRTAYAQWLAYQPGTYGVNVACGDLNGTGLDEIVTGRGPGPQSPPHVRGWRLNGVSLSDVTFLAYGTNKYGVNVTTGDIDGDGYDEIITGPGPGAVFGPHVRGWNYDGAVVTAMTAVNFIAYGTHKWGANVTSGDIDSDGYDEIITGAGPSTYFGPHVRGWNYDARGRILAMSGVSFMAYASRMGVNVAAGNINGDGRDEIITGPGPGSWNGAHVRGWRYANKQTTFMEGVSFIAYPSTYGVVVSAGQANSSGRDEILTMPGPGPFLEAWARAWEFDGTYIFPEYNINERAYDQWMKYGGKIAGGNLSGQLE